MTNRFKSSLFAGVAAVALISGTAFAQVPASPAPGAMMENGGSTAVNPPNPDSPASLAQHDAMSPPPAGGPGMMMHHDGGMHHQWTLEEARKHAHARADMLDKMTPAQFAAEEKERHDKWQNMTPGTEAGYESHAPSR